MQDRNNDKVEYFTKMPNGLIEAMATAELNGTQFRILLCVSRYTFGFQRESHDLSVSFIAQMTGSHPSRIKPEVNKLIEAGIIKVYKPPSFNTSREMGINMNFEHWKSLRSQGMDSIPGSEEEPVQVSDSLLQPGSGSATQEKKALNKNLNKEASEKRKGRIDLSISADVDRLYKMYPRHKGKAGAFKKLPALIKEFGTDRIAGAIEAFARDIKGRDPEYIPYASTFFNKGIYDYLDDPEDTPNSFPDIVEVEVYNS